MGMRCVEAAGMIIRRLGLVGLLGLASLAGCSGLEPVASYTSETDPTQLLLSLRLAPRAITLSTDSSEASYNTWQLTATPYDGRGEPMPSLPAPTFRLQTLGDSTRLRVTPAGRLTAVASGTNINVIAELVVPGPGGYPVRQADTAHVNITTTTPPPVLASVSIDPPPSDSTVFAMASPGGGVPSLNRGKTLQPSASTTTGTPITGLVFEYTSLDPTIATVDPWSGVMSGLRPGYARMVVRTTAYGLTQVDTTVFTVTWPITGVVNVDAGVFSPTEIRVVSNGLVEWITQGNSATADPVDVTFDDPTNVMAATNPAIRITCLALTAVYHDPTICAAGDPLLIFHPIPPDFTSFTGVSFRQFPVPGIYRYHSTRTGAAGQIVVTNEIPASGTGP